LVAWNVVPRSKQMLIHEHVIIGEITFTREYMLRSHDQPTTGEICLK